MPEPDDDPIPGPAGRFVTRQAARFGALPAAPLYLASVAVAALGGWLLDDGGAGAVVIAAPVLFLVYCVCRPNERAGVFGLAVAPSAVSTLAHGIFGIDRLWVALPVFAISLALMWEQDRDDRRARRLSSAAEPPAAL